MNDSIDDYRISVLARTNRKISAIKRVRELLKSSYGVHSPSLLVAKNVVEWSMTTTKMLTDDEITSYAFTQQQKHDESISRKTKMREELYECVSEWYASTPDHTDQQALRRLGERCANIFTGLEYLD
jgi:hypothetical protein